MKRDKNIQKLSIIFLLGVFAALSCQKVNPPRVNKQDNGTVEIPASNLADQPFSLTGQDSTVSLSGTILIWNEAVPASIVTQMMELSRDQRFAQAEFISELPDLRSAKTAVSVTDKALKDYISSYYENQHETLLAESKTWFSDALNALPEDLVTNSEKKVIYNKFKSFCEAKLFETATMFFFIKSNLFSERPSPFSLCEGVYSEMKLFDEKSAACAKSEAPKDYYECLWLEGVVKTDLFKTQYTPENQAYLTQLVTQPNYQGKTIRDMLDDSSIYNELLDTPAGFDAIKLTEEQGCCKRNSDSRPRSALDALTKEGGDLNDIIARVNPRYILENALSSDLVAVRTLTDYSKGSPNSKKDKKAQRFTHVFAPVIEKAALFADEEKAKEILAPVERIITVLSSYGLRPQSSPYALISLSDYQVSATTTYLPNGERPTLTLATDLLATAEANVTTLAPNLLPKESQEFLDQVKALEASKEAAVATYEDAVVKSNVAIEKFTHKNQEIVELGINSLLKPENQDLVYTDSGLNIMDKGSYFEFIFWFTTEDAPKHDVCFSKETSTQIECPSLSGVGDILTDKLEVSYDQKSGELVLWTDDLDPDVFGLKVMPYVEGDSNFNHLEPEKIKGKRFELVIYTSDVKSAITAGVGSVHVIDKATDKTLMEGSLDFSDYAQREQLHY